MIAVSRLLKSCATPPARRPIASVVRRAFAQRRFVERAAAVAGHQDEGLVGAEIFGGPDQLETGSVGQPLIDEVDVVFVGLDPFETSHRGRDDFYSALEMRIDERHLDERLSLWVVIDQQNADVTKVVLRTRWTSHANRTFGLIERFQH